MEEKILAKLEQLDAKMDDMKEEFRQENETLREEFRQENEKIRQEFKQDNDKLREEFRQENDKIRQEFKQDNDKLREEFRQENEKIRQDFKQDNDKLREEFKQENKTLREELHEEMNDFRKEMLDKMFLFEQDYGAKIDAIFDVAIMQKDIIQTVYKNQEELKIRVDNLDIKLLALDQRVFKLEHPKNLKQLIFKKSYKNREYVYYFFIRSNIYALY